MEAIKIKIGPLVFDHADYDPESDVLYLHTGAPQDAEGEETPEGHVLRFEPSTQRIVGLTVLNARWLLDRDGHFTVTIPETVQASADDLAPALAAALTDHTADVESVFGGESSARIETRGTREVHQVDHERVCLTRPSRPELRLCRDFIARSARAWTRFRP